MTIPPDHDEMRIRGQLRDRIDGAPALRPVRERDWLDDIVDAGPDDPAPAPAHRPAKAATEQPARERRWDFSKLRRWPYARPAWGACLALLPVFRGQSAALAWGHVLTQARDQAGIGAAYVIAAVGLGLGLLWVHRRRSWIGWAVLTCAFVGGVDMSRIGDIVQFTTGAVK